MLVRIKRQDAPDKPPYWQEFEYNGDLNVSVAHVIETLNYEDDIVDTSGKSARRIRWDCSCMQKVCGACAMIICGKPALACDTFLNEIKKDVLVLEPLSKFPVISDLKVDRSIIQQQLLDAGLYDERNTVESEKDHEQCYQISKCLKCGLCLEVCPNYVGGKRFFGANIANDAFVLYSENGQRKNEIKKSYKEHFSKGCSKSLACMNVCPMGIKTVSSMGRMNRG